MIRLNLPPYPIKVRETFGKRSIFDILRRKYVALTPEEWVRQHFIHFLVEHKGYPATLLANEVPLHIGNKTVRADSVLYDNLLHPKMIVEYKAPTIVITQKVLTKFPPTIFCCMSTIWLLATVLNPIIAKWIMNIKDTFFLRIFQTIKIFNNFYYLSILLLINFLYINIS